jgi:hypothetical protein
MSVVFFHPSEESQHWFHNGLVHLAEGIGSVVHERTGVVGGAKVPDFGEVVLEKVVLHPGLDVSPVYGDEVVPAHSHHTFISKITIYAPMIYAAPA